MTTDVRNLTRGSLLARNTVWNLLGLSIPLPAALIVIPLLMRGMGTARFGVLTLIWALVGYYNLFDLGIGRALTKLVSEKLGSGDDEGIPHITVTALSLLTLFGAAGMLLLYFLSPWVVKTVLSVPAGLQDEVITTFHLSAFAIPLIVISGALAGFLAALQKFNLINMVRIPMGVFFFVGPALLLPFTASLPAMTAVILVGRFLAIPVQCWFCARAYPGLLRRLRLPSLRAIRQLLSFGGWMTVSNVISPIMVSMDRFIIAMMSVAAVAYYATSQEMILKLSIVPAAAAATLFPALSTATSSDHSRMIKLYHRSLSSLILIMFPVCFLLVTWSFQLLSFWLGSDFSQKGGMVLQLLTLGIFINGLAHLPSVMLQSAGRPDLTAKIHLLELPVFLLLIFGLCSWLGIEGAAISWVIRVTVDLILLLWLLKRSLDLDSVFPQRVRRTMALCVILFFFGAYISSPLAKMPLTIAALTAFFYVSWQYLLSGEEKSFVTRQLRIIPIFNRA